uniref:Prosaposin-like n=1 Tax=Crassostrea virginica TaxID=6565 RepID=A0A8B8CF52_CRAVI|nr:prosaposin-like [Crassostrea virginica]
MQRIIFALCVIAFVTAAPNIQNDLMTCEICHVAVHDLQKLMAENATQATVEQRLEDICNRLTSHVDDCLGFVKTKAPDIFNTLSDKLDPESICILLDVCPKANDFREESAPVKVNTPSSEEASPLECEICKLLVTELDNLLKENRSQEVVIETVHKLCNALPDAFKKFCDAYAPEIIELIVSGVEPKKACSEIKLCSEYEKDQAKSSQTETKKITEDPKCEICKLIVNEVDWYIKRNASAGTINATVTKVCNKLPSAFKLLCTAMAPGLVKHLEDGLDPASSCVYMKMCSQATPLVEINRKDEVIPLITISHIHLTFILLCCDLIAPTIVKKIEGGFDPQTACKDIKLCTVQFSGVIDESLQEIVSNIKEQNDEKKFLEDAKCELCEFLINIIDQELGQNASLDKINNTVYSLCNLLPDAIKATCELIAPSIVKELAGGLDPLKTCEKLKLCTNGTQSIGLLQGIKEHVTRSIQGPSALSPQDAKCELCEFLVNIIDKELGQNASLDKINNTIYGICNLLPATIQPTCDLIAPTIVKELAKGLDPLKTCETVKMCTNGTMGYNLKDLKELKRRIGIEVESDVKQVKDSAGCELCEFVVQIVDEYIKNNNTGESINTTVYKICALLPEPILDLCNQAAPNIVKAIENGVDPKKVCTDIKLCQNGAYEITLTLPGVSCEMCHGLVEAVLSRQYTETLALRLCEVTCPREHVRHRRSIVKKMSHFEVDLLKAQEEDVKIKVGNDIECDVCTWLAEATNIFLQDNKTEDAIEKYLDAICKFIPEPYSKTCLDTVPLIIKELEHGFEPKKLCKELVPEDCKNVTKVFGDLPNVASMVIHQIEEPSQKCDLCKKVMKIFADELDKDDTKVLAYIRDVCHRLPNPTNTACLNFVQKEYSVISEKIIQRLLDPTKVCEMVRICPQN